MFSSAFFTPKYFNKYFKITGEILDIGVVPSGGGGGQAGVIVNQSQLRALGLRKDDQDVLEFIVAFVLSRR